MKSIIEIEGSVVNIQRSLLVSNSNHFGSVMLDTSLGSLTIPLEDIRKFKYCQKVKIKIELSTDE
jgi:hypothetical protein